MTTPRCCWCCCGCGALPSERDAPFGRASRAYAGAASLLLVASVGLVLVGPGSDFAQGLLLSDLRSTLYATSASSPAYAPLVNSSNPANAPILASFCVYNVTNVDAVASAGAAPSLGTEVCLAYSYIYEHLNASWPVELNNDVVSYTTYQSYVPTTSGDAYSAIVTTANVPLIAAASVPVVAALIALEPGLHNLSLARAAFIDVSASQVLFGWESADLALLNKHLAPLGVVLPTLYQGLVPADASPEAALATHSPSYMWTGALTEAAANTLYAWDGSRDVRACQFGPCGDADSGGGAGVPGWASLGANAVAGTAIGQWHVDVDCSEPLRVATYDSAAYRWWELQCGPGTDAGAAYWGSDAYEVEGISVLRFRLPSSALSNASVVPANAAWGGGGSSCPTGLVNATITSEGAPIFLSKPRFLDADASLASALQGLQPPDRALHDTYVGVEALTGIALDFHFRLAINVHLRPLPPFLWGTLPSVFLPLAWCSQDSAATSDLAANLRATALTPAALVASVRYVGIGIAAAAGAAALAFFAFALCSHVRTLQDANSAAAADEPAAALDQEGSWGGAYANAGRGGDGSNAAPLITSRERRSGGGGSLRKSIQ